MNMKLETIVDIILERTVNRIYPKDCVVTACFGAPPHNMTLAPTTWNGLPALEGEVIHYRCPVTYATALGKYNTTLVCQEGDWVPEDTQYDLQGLLNVFICEPGKQIHLLNKFILKQIHLLQTCHVTCQKCKKAFKHISRRDANCYILQF